MKKIAGEFRDFIMRGNVMDLAVGVIIGAAFQGIVTSLTDNILSPILGLFTGNSFDEWHFEVLGVSIRYGAFLTSVVNFLILAAVVFALVKLMNRVLRIGKKEEAPAVPTTKACPFCLSEVRIGAVRCPSCTSQLEE